MTKKKSTQISIKSLLVNQPGLWADWQAYGYNETVASAEAILKIRGPVAGDLRNQRVTREEVYAIAVTADTAAGGDVLDDAQIKVMQEMARKGGHNKDLLKIDYLAINKTVELPGHLVSFEDTYAPSWNTEEVYGRMDPIVTYQGTTRKISLQYEIDTQGGTLPQLGGTVGGLIQFLYPVYHSKQVTDLGAGTLAASPLWRLKYSCNPDATEAHLLGGSNGFLLAVDSFNIAKFSATKGDKGELDLTRMGGGYQGIIPTKYTLTIGGYVFHEDAKAGWVWKRHSALSFGTSQGGRYPYGDASAVTTTATATGKGSSAQKARHDQAKQGFEGQAKRTKATTDAYKACKSAADDKAGKKKCKSIQYNQKLADQVALKQLEALTKRLSK